MRTSAAASLKNQRTQRSFSARNSCDAKSDRQRRPAKAHKLVPVALLEERFAVGERPVLFAYFNQTASKVFIAGEFNQWQPDSIAMKKSEDGRWSVDITLAPGKYEYRLIVDGVWQEDPMSERFAANPFGGLNSVALVGP